VTRDEMRDKIQGAIDYLNANPQEASYTDSAATARLSDPAGLRVDVSGPNGAQMATDMPTSVGGTNSATSPGWYLRAAAAACVATLIGMRAAHQGITLDDVEVTVDSESDDRGILGADDAIVAGPLSTRVAVKLRAVGASQQQLQELVNWAVVHCPVTDAVRRAIPMSVELEIG
jgi:uncharacterized OsmC-like protein